MQNPQQIIIIPKTTEAEISNEFVIPNGSGSITVIANGLAGSETATIELYDPALDEWYPAKNNGTVYVLDKDNNTYDIWQSWGRWRINKIATAAEVGVSIRGDFHYYAI